MKIAWLQDLPLNTGRHSGAESNDEAMIEYGRVILKHKIDVINPREQAAPYIIRSKIIVAENSSVLWWAKLLNDEKILISIDFFNLPLGDHYKDDPAIQYFKSIDELKTISHVGFEVSDHNNNKPGFEEIIANIKNEAGLGNYPSCYHENDNCHSTKSRVQEFEFVK